MNQLKLPATFARSQIIAAFDAFGLTGDAAEAEIASLNIIGERIDVELFVYTDDGVITLHGDNATVTVSIPIDEDVAFNEDTTG